MPVPSSITGPRLRLDPPSSEDESAWMRLHRDPRTYAHAPHAMPATDDEARQRFCAARKSFSDNGFGVWMVRSHEADEVIGVCGVRPVGEGEDAFLNLYYRLDHDHLGRGYGREMARAVVVVATEWLAERPVRALVKEHNHASVATAERIGMERIGTRVLSDDVPDEPASTVFQLPRVEPVTSVDDETRAAILDLWCRVTAHDGGVGLPRTASRAEHEALLARHEASMADGFCVAGVLRSPTGDVRGVGFLEQVRNPMMRHNRSVFRVMTDPERRGRSLGLVLMAGLHRIAREHGAEIMVLYVGSGSGTESFYERVGYREVGRIPRAIRMAPGDERDDITMSRRLDLP